MNVSHLTLIILCVPAGPPFLCPLHCLLSEWSLCWMSRPYAAWNPKRCRSRNSGRAHRPDRQPSSGKQGQAAVLIPVPVPDPNWIWYWILLWCYHGNQHLNFSFMEFWWKSMKLLFGQLGLPEGCVCSVVTSVCQHSSALFIDHRCTRD